ncbi:hypothetical protein DL95DRAFT_482314, partial [Leptodontidium sp. 2 PMI_412]
LAPYAATIDGKDPPVAFNEKFISGIIQSPLAVNLTLLSSSCYQAAARGLEVEKCAEAITIEGRIISLIVNYIERNNKEIRDDAILTWYWGEEHRVWAHMKGLKEMLRLRGGIENMTIDLWLRRQIISADYQMACCTERDLFLLKDLDEAEDLPALDSTLALFDNPLYTPSACLKNIVETRDLGLSTIEILDDMKFLTTSILAIQSTIATPQSIAKFKATALWAHNRVAALPSITPTLSNSTEDLIYETIRLTALLYCTAITSHSPFSQTCQPAIFKGLWNTMWLVSFSRWKKIPGIFLWVMLVACPSSNDKAHRAFLKMNIWMVSLYIGLSSHEIANGCLKTFLKVQKWVKNSEKA